MARGDHWWSEPPWWAWVVMIVSLVAIVVMLPIALNRKPPETSEGAAVAPEQSSSPATGSAAGSTASAPAASSSPGKDDAAQVLVVGDADTAGSAAGGQGWTAVVEQRLPGVEMTVATTGDTGYVTTGAATDATLPQLVDAADLSDVDVVVLFGSRFDGAGIADKVSVAAGVAIGEIREKAPQAQLVVIGPDWPDAAPPAGVRNNRAVIRSAAETAGALFVDPIADGWLTDAPDLLGPDGEHLTAAADTYLADRIEPLISQALAA